MTESPGSGFARAGVLDWFYLTGDLLMKRKKTKTGFS